MPSSVVSDKCAIPWRILLGEEQPVAVVGHGQGQSQRHGQIQGSAAQQQFPQAPARQQMQQQQVGTTILCTLQVYNSV